MKALIISDSGGTRLRPVTCSIPKLCMPVVGRAAVCHTLRLLHRHNITEVALCADYLQNEAAKAIQKDIPTDICVKMLKREELSDFLYNDDTLIISGSIITDINLDEMIEAHKKSGASATLALRSHADFIEYGIATVDTSMRISLYNRAAYSDFEGRKMSFMGIMLLSKAIKLKSFDGICTIAQNVVEETSSAFGYIPKEYIRDVSDIESYLKCNRDFLDKKVNLPFPCDEKESGVWIDKSAQVVCGCVITPPVFIGANAVINRGARIEAYSVIGEGVNIGSLSGIKRSVIMDNAHISAGASLRGTVICKNANVGTESMLYEGSILGEGSFLGAHCLLKQGVRIWPQKRIDDESIVSSNIIWENMSPHSMFYEGCVTGKINNMLTPEFCASLGCSAAKLLGGKIAVSESGSPASAMLKAAVCAGLQSFGSEVYDFGEQPLPITRRGIRFHKLDGGISISSFIKDDELYAGIDILNSYGGNVDSDVLSELDGLILSGEVKRAHAKNICEVQYLFEYKLYYLKQLINDIHSGNMGMKILIKCVSDWAKRLLESASADLGCNFVFLTNVNDEEFSTRVYKGDYSFGVIIDYKCENIEIVTNEGRILSRFDYGMLVSLIIMKSYKHAEIYVPHSYPEELETLADKYGAVIKRTRLSAPSVMKELTAQNNEMLFRQFIYHFDALGALVSLLDFLFTEKISLNDLIYELPEGYITESSVGCSSKLQSEMLKNFFVTNVGTITEYDDSVKLTFDNGWALVVPNKNKAEIRVISHSYSEEYAREIASVCIDRLLSASNSDKRCT